MLHDDEDEVTDLPPVPKTVKKAVPNRKQRVRLRSEDNEDEAEPIRRLEFSEPFERFNWELPEGIDEQGQREIALSFLRSIVRTELLLPNVVRCSLTANGTLTQTVSMRTKPVFQWVYHGNP